MVFHMEMKDIGNIKNLQNKKVFLDFLKIVKSALTSFLRKAIEIMTHPLASVYHFHAHKCILAKDRAIYQELNHKCVS